LKSLGTATGGSRLVALIEKHRKRVASRNGSKGIGVRLLFLIPPL